MTDKINEDFVGIHLDSGGIWTFIIPGKVEHISECIDRFEEIAYGVFNACEGFIRPTEIGYSVQTYSDDGPLESVNSMNDTADVELLSVERKTIVNESGLTAEDIPFESYAHQDEGVRRIGDIVSTRTQTHLKLNAYDGWVDQTDERYVKPARFDEVYNGKAKHDPIGIRLDHGTTSASTADANSTFGIAIESPTDIWFEETPIGRTNRRQLETLFERLFERFDVVDTDVTSRKSNQKLREFFPD